MKINNLSEDKKVYNLLKKSLDVSSTRAEVIRNNISNFNTKGYKRYFVSFEDSLNNNINELDLKTTEKKHISLDNKEDFKIQKDTNSTIREDGNNVDVDQEMIGEAENTLMYNALITQLNNRLSLRKIVINDGRR